MQPVGRLAALLVSGVISGCGGAVGLGGPSLPTGADAGADGMGAGTAEDAGQVDSMPPVDASMDQTSACVEITVSPSDRSCTGDMDCALALSGEICGGQCSCGDTPVNATAAARYASETASLALAACPCVYPGAARCLGGQCTRCGLGPDQPAGCSDAATTTAQDGGEVDGALDGEVADTRSDVSTDDASACVDIDLSTYDTSCMLASDCVDITAGELCSGSCRCGGSAVNQSEQARYDKATAGLRLGLCPCPAELPPLCVGNKCIIGALAAGVAKSE